MTISLIMVFSVLSFVPICSSECIRFEFHEKITSSFEQSELLRAMCLGKGGRIIDYSLQIIPISGPLIFNVTFHCCAPSLCNSDHDCPINFNCNYGLCSIADCNLTDETEIILQEGRTCFIDDDCYFETPYDSVNWKCLPDPWCFHNKTCDISYNFCKRCPTGYIDADPKKFIPSSDGTIQPPTTLSPWWLTASPTTPSPPLSPFPIDGDINRINPIDQPFLHDHHEHSLPNLTEPSLDSVSTTTPISRISTPSTTPDPITVGYDELSPNTGGSIVNNTTIADDVTASGVPASASNDINTNTSNSFESSDLPVNLSDDELISNVTIIDLARIDSVDEINFNSTENESTSSIPISN